MAAKKDSAANAPTFVNFRIEHIEYGRIFLYNKFGGMLETRHAAEF